MCLFRKYLADNISTEADGLISRKLWAQGVASCEGEASKSTVERKRLEPINILDKIGFQEKILMQTSSQEGPISRGLHK